MKKIFKVIIISFGILAILVILSIIFFRPDETIIVDYIKENPDKVAIKLVRNDTVLVERNPNKMMPLASTVKIIIAIEYAIQAANNQINPESYILLDDLEKFYIPNTDGGAHPSWLKSIKSKIQGDSVSIREIAKGMIRYSSNANTEWLCAKLGLENINARIDNLGIVDHSPIYFIVSALFIAKEKFPDEQGVSLVKKMRELSNDEYISICNDIHMKLLADSDYKTNIGELEKRNIQRVWSDYLPASTVNEYAELMKKINSKKYFDQTIHSYLDEVMESRLRDNNRSDIFKHYGMKGGSTSFVLTSSFYATDKEGNKIELAYFFDDIGKINYPVLSDYFYDFADKILINSEFRNIIRNDLQQ